MEAQVAALRALSETAVEVDQQRSLTAISELRKTGFKPLASANLLYELGRQLQDICNLITKDPTTGASRMANLPDPRLRPVPNPAKAE